MKEAIFFRLLHTATILMYQATTQIFSNYDGWVVRIDSLRVIQWQKCIGGSYTEQLFDIKENSKGNFITCGFADSNDGDLSGLNPDFSSAWVIELSSRGKIL